MNKPVIRDRITRKVKFKPYMFKKPSMTIPGQELTPQEILRNFVVKRNTNPMDGMFPDIDVSKFIHLDEMERLDLIREKRRQVGDLRQELVGLAKVEYESQQAKLRPPVENQTSEPKTQAPQSLL